MMKHLVSSTIIVSLMFGIIFSRKIKYFSNFGDGKLLLGLEHSIKDYVTLSNDPKADLPKVFTICTSVKGEFMVSEYNFFSLISDENSRWIDAALDDVRKYILSERIEIEFYGKERKFFGEKRIPIYPNSWRHFCLGFNNTNGNIRMAMDGILLADEKVDSIVENSYKLPKSLEGKLSGKKE